MSVIDGKTLAQKIEQEVKSEITSLKIKPKLVMIAVEENLASQIYLKNKVRVCEYVGISSEVVSLAKDTSEIDLIEKIGQLNKDKAVDAILVQMPLPEQIDAEKIIQSIDPDKDVDCLHPVNQGKLLLLPKTGFAMDTILMPCTPRGILYLLESENVDLVGKKIVIINRSNLVGKPLAALLISCGATVCVCHSQTNNLANETRQADILVSAVGKPSFVKAEMVKKGAIVVDVGISRIDGKIVGDVDFGAVSKKAMSITPVPGGVGPMTVACLLDNVLFLIKNKFIS